VPLDGGPVRESYLNDLYRRVINRNNRLQKLICTGRRSHPPQRKRMLAGAVTRCSTTAAAPSDPRARQAALKSLSDMLKGKQAGSVRTARQSAWTIRPVVISVGPELRRTRAGSPRRWRSSCVKPFIIHKLVE